MNNHITNTKPVKPNTFAIASSLSNSSLNQAFIKFYGHAAIVPFTHPSYQRTIQQLQQIVSTTRNDTKLSDFRVIINDFLEHLINPQMTLRQYQLELLNDVIVSYFNSLKTRMHTSPERVNQITDILSTLLITREDPHPSSCLLALEKVLTQINSKHYFFPSSLSSSLQYGINRQWQPILRDNRQLLQNVGGKLVFLGLLGVIGWPLVFLYPLIGHSQRLLQIANDFERSRRISPQAIFDLGKILVMAFVCYQLTSVISLYVTFGYTAGTIGLGAFAIAQSDRLMKEISPTLAQHAPTVDKVLTFLESGDLQQLRTLIRSVNPNTENRFPQSDQVEELPPDSSLSPLPVAPIVEEVEDDDIDPSLQIPTKNGLRQRK